MAGKTKWYGEQIQEMIRAEMGRRIDACCIAVEGYAKKLLSVEGGTKLTGRDSKCRFQSKIINNTNPSKPGEPPHKQSGHLLGKVAHERTGLIGRVGTSVPYGRLLELGTSRMAARPWLRRSLNAMQGFIRAVMSRPIK